MEEVKTMAFSEFGSERECEFHHEEDMAQHFIGFSLSASSAMDSETAIESMIMASVVKFMCWKKLPTLGEFLKLATRVYSEVDELNAGNKEIPRMPVRRNHA